MESKLHLPNNFVKDGCGVVLVRADGSKQIGMGHLYRAYLLSNMFRDKLGMRAKLIMRNDLAAEKFLGDRDIETIPLPESITINEEIELLKEITEIEQPLLYVLDVLEQDINKSYVKAVRGFGCPVVAISDDSLRRVIDADIVINGNPNQIGQDYSDTLGKYLLGPMYFLMDQGYENIKVKVPSGYVQKILLTFGGSDHNNLLFRVLDTLEGMKRKLSVLIIASEGSGYVDRLQKYIKQSNIPCELFVGVSSLVPFWEQCDLAITAAGNTLFERIAARLPGATLCQLDRQMEIADRFESLDVNINLGSGQNVSDDILSKRIADFIDNRELHHLQYLKSPQIIDGKGLRRFISEVQSLLNIYQDGLRETDKTI